MGSSGLRWDGDMAGRGVADAGLLAPYLAALLEAARESGWVAEEPDQHLLPRLLAALEAGVDGLSLVSWRIDAGALELTISKSDGFGPRQTRGAIFRLLGAVAETVTFVRELDNSGQRRFEVCTGTLDGDGPFSGHGHVLRFVVDETAAS